MTDNVGLSTPRGSGTSGYVQRNLSHLKPRQQNPFPNSNNPLHRTAGHPYAKPSSSSSPFADNNHPSYRQRQPDPEILLHERRRKIEVQVFAERDKLEEAGELEEEEVDERCEGLRRKLVAEMEREMDGGGGGGGKGGKGLKRHQVHELAEAKIVESERLRRALGIAVDYEEGGHWRRREEREREKMASAVAGGRGVKEAGEGPRRD